MPVCLSPDEEKVIKSACKDRFVCSPAVKCSGVKESDMTPKNMNICRAHLSQTIEAVKPKIVFACGNLPLKMLLKKSGIKDKRGNIYEYVSDNGYKCLVMATLHPYMAVVEPKYLEVFLSDVKNGILKGVHGAAENYGFSFEIIDTVDKLSMLDFLVDTEDTIAFDTETTGLSFLDHKITMLSLAHNKMTFAIPIYHKDSPWGENLPLALKKIKLVLENPKNIKVAHNTKFDLKHLRNLDIFVTNHYDTKIMGKLLDENSNNSLADLVKTHFPLFMVEDVRR
jgi:uncharacterized protein YprB with RNaseH-like and TPR domain